MRVYIPILFFIAFNTIIRLYTNTYISVPFVAEQVDAYNYGNLLSLMIACAIPAFTSKGFDRLLSVCLVALMAWNYADAMSFDYSAYSIYDIAVYACICIVLFAAYGRGYKPTKYSIPLLAILPVFIITRTSLHFTDNHGIVKYWIAIGDATVFFLVSIYSGFQLRNKYEGLTFFFFMLCMGNWLDNTVYDPYTRGRYEVVFAMIMGVDAVLMAIRKRYARTAEMKRLHRHIFIAVNVLMVAAVIFIPL